MRRPWQVWTAFGVCLAVVLASLAWVTLMALRLEAREAEALRQATLEENVRLALWRMDSAVSPLLTRESARPYFVYSSFYPVERAYTKMFQELKGGEILTPSPLLTESIPHVLLHFQLAPDGQLTSPQVPTGNTLDLAQTGYVRPEQVTRAEARLKTLAKLVSSKELLAALPQLTPRPAPVIERARTTSPPSAAQSSGEQRPLISRNSRASQTALNANEYQARQQSVAQSNVALPESASPLELSEGGMTSLWAGELLLVMRRVSVDRTTYVQGYWLDWPGLRTWLLVATKDLLPDSELVPVTAGSGVEQSRLLASLPVRLEPGKLARPANATLSPVRISLLMVWSCALLAAAVAAMLLAGVVSLSERRQSFVSAVTHELRTPLTTFRMYAEMLADGMVIGDQKKQSYLTTMKGEAERLSSLVENVLAYARLEKGRLATRAETLPLRELLARTGDPLTRRARQADMQLVIESREPALAARVRVDPAAVEQILFNLVDNACKYAATASDRRIHLVAQESGRHALLMICDHGPGVSSRDARRLFRPFSKSADEGAGSVPGVGLGLVLSRRLARLMGGDLTLSPRTGNGACFLLRLPLDRNPGPAL